MTRIFSLLVAFILITAPTLAMAGDWPDWVQETQPPVAYDDVQEFIDGGVHNILYDVQVQLTPDGNDRFTRRMVKIVSRAGLEEVGSARFDYDPAGEELIIHGIWRDRDGDRVKIENLEYIDIRRESDLDYGILDGRLTRYADIADLRVGDVIDMSWSIRARPKVFPKHFLYWRTQQPTNGYQFDHFRLLAPKDREITITGPARPTVSEAGEWVSYHWHHENTAAPDFTDSIKPWQELYGETQITTTSDWQAVNERLVDAYVPQRLPSALVDIVDKFEGTEDQRVTAAFRLVQEQIRYMGIEIGAGGYLPRTPGTVWSRRFGDCKDKALLLVSILDHMDIPSDVVLVNLYEGTRLADYAPSPYLFNHAIVRVLSKKGAYFLDPTDVFQGGVARHIRTSDFKWALPVTVQSDALVPVPPPFAKEPSYDVLSRYEFTPNAAFAAHLYETTTYRGDDADRQRSRFAHDGTEDRADGYLEWYQGRYPGTQVVSPIWVEDDLDANILIVHEHYGIPAEGLADHRSEFWMNPYGTKGELEELPEGELDAPYEVAPMFYRHRVELVGVPKLKVPPEIRMNNPFFRYTRLGSAIEDGVAAEFEIEMLTRKIHPHEAEAYRAAVDEQDRKDDRRFNLGLSTQVMAKPLVMGMTVRSALTYGSFLFVACLGWLAWRRGFAAERNAWANRRAS